MSTVYLLHFSQPLGNPRNPRALAQHYLGWSPLPLQQRLAQHRNGKGAAITRAAMERGIEWECVATWDGDYRLEKKIKRLHAGPRLCPICGRKHKAGALHVQVLYMQLELPLWDEWEPIPPRNDRMSWFELQYIRSRPVVRYQQHYLPDGCDIPF